MKKIEELQLLHNALEKRYEKFDIIYTFEGIFDKDVISIFSKKITLLTKFHPKAQKRLFTVFIELAQNVGYYSDLRMKIADEKETGVGGLIIGENSEIFFFIIGNKITEKALEVLHKKCEIINSLDREELREFKRQQRNLIPGTNGGAHIGLILVALTTKRPLNVTIFDLKNEESLFTIVVEVNKTSALMSEEDD